MLWGLLPYSQEVSLINLVFTKHPKSNEAWAHRCVYEWSGWCHQVCVCINDVFSLSIALTIAMGGPPVALV